MQVAGPTPPPRPGRAHAQKQGRKREHASSTAHPLPPPPTLTRTTASTTGVIWLLSAWMLAFMPAMSSGPAAAHGRARREAATARRAHVA